MSDTGGSIKGRYVGQRGPLFSLAFKTALLTAVTLGIYRFWAKTRIRKYVWSSVGGDGDSFEYTGTGLEKLLGFLVAIVILAIYLGFIQMVLFYFGLTLFTEPTSQAQVFAQIGAFYLTVLAVLPLIFFAQYRARRYKLARTRWRGLRFGADRAAWGYAIRAMGHLVLTVATLGLLWPRQTFLLEKFVTDRSWYGDAKFEQGGRWISLYPAMKHLFIGVGILTVGVGAAAALGAPGLAAASGFGGYIWLMVGYVSYRVNAFRYLTANKTLDGSIRFQAQPETSQIVGTVLVGGIVVVLATAAVGAVLGGATMLFAGPGLTGGSVISSFAGLAVIAMSYIGILAFASAMSLVWITQPIIEHLVNTVVIENAARLDEIRQRAPDTGADAEGFADALDVGGAI